MRESLRDVRFGLRMLRKSPAFALVAIATLTLGIGANTAIFSFVDAWILRPLPYADSDRLMVLTSRDVRRGGSSVSVADFLDWQSQNQTFQQLVAYNNGSFTLTGVND